MKRFLLSGSLFFLLIGCTTTGDWNEDGLGFSRAKADQRLAAQRAQLRAMESQNQGIQNESSILEESVAKAGTGRRRDVAERGRLEAEIAARERELAHKEARLSAMQAANTPNAEALRSLQAEIATLKTAITRKRKMLAVIIYTR